MFCWCDLDLDPITLIYKLERYFWKMYPLTENELSRSRILEVITLHTKYWHLQKYLTCHHATMLVVKDVIFIDYKLHTLTWVSASPNEFPEFPADFIPAHLPITVGCSMVLSSVRPSTPFSTDTDTPILCCQPIPIRYRYAARAAVAQCDWQIKGSRRRRCN